MNWKPPPWQDLQTLPVYRSAGQGQPNPTPLPHEIPHSQPPRGAPPAPEPREQVITPNTRPLPMGPGNVPPWTPRR
jgi:hypothetical protein